MTTVTMLPPSDEGVETVVALLRAGALVGIPTETVYGLGGDASDERGTRIGRITADAPERIIGCRVRTETTGPARAPGMLAASYQPAARAIPAGHDAALVAASAGASPRARS